MSVIGHWIVALTGILLIFRATEGSWYEAFWITGQALSVMVVVTVVAVIWVWLS